MIIIKRWNDDILPASCTIDEMKAGKLIVMATYQGSKETWNGYLSEVWNDKSFQGTIIFVPNVPPDKL